MRHINIPYFNLPYPVSHDLEMVKSYIQEAAEQFRRLTDKKPMLWCRGSSGAICAAIFSFYVPGCVICHVKKPGEDSHSTGTIYYSEPIINQYVHVIIDDFMATGRTIEKIHERFLEAYPRSEIFAVIVSSIQCPLPINSQYLITHHEPLNL